MRPLIVLWACCLIWSAGTLGVAADSPVALPQPEQFHLYLLAGQSNMAGRGKVTDADRTPHPRVLMLNKAGEWVPAVDPMHFDKPGIVGVGLGRTFGIDMAELDPNVTIGLIPCAVGGSGIDSWKPSGVHPETKTKPWDDAIARTGVALKSGTLKGILWHQGESDSGPKLADEYEAKLHDLIARFRKEFENPDLPFVAGQLGQFEDSPWSEGRKTVDTAHRLLPEKVPHTAFVSSDDLKHKGDGTHFDADSCRTFGHRFAAEYQKLTPKK